jgi:Protein of unknown function (DUF1559)
MRTLFPLAVLAALGVAVVAAPVPKDKDKKEDFGPITDEQLKQSSNNLKQILLAMHNYESANGHFPNNTVVDGKPGLSWRVHLLPYLEQDHLYKQFNLSEAWDSDTNKKLIAKLPKEYTPIRAKTKDEGMTFYRGFTGGGTVFESGLRLSIVAISDGSSNTIAVVEAGESCVWTKPDDLPFGEKKDLPKLGGLFDGAFHVGLCDGSVRKVKAKFDAATLKAMITRAGGEVISTDGLDD